MIKLINFFMGHPVLEGLEFFVAPWCNPLTLQSEQ